MTESQFSSLSGTSSKDVLEKISGDIKDKKVKLSVDDLKDASTTKCLEAAVAIQVDKTSPVGYEEVSDFFRNEYDDITDAHCVWLLAEAEKAGKVEDMEKEFPDMRRRADRLVEYMKKQHPRIVSAIIDKVSKSGYSVSGLKKE
jgi:hypothetical protein